MKAVTLEDILVKPKKVEIPIPGKMERNDQGMPDAPKLVYWVRPSLQPERDLAGAAGRTASRMLRRKLEDPDSEERQLLVLDELEGATEDSLQELWVTQKVIERAATIRHRSLEDRDITYVPEPEGDLITGEDMDRYENEVEDVEEQREMSVLEAVTSAREELQKEVERMTPEQLREYALPLVISTQTERAYENEFVSQLIYRCTFLDNKCKKRAFTDVNQVYNLKDFALIKLSNAHMSFILDPEQVKNLAGGLKS
jgi:hypothetical protein